MNLNVSCMVNVSVEDISVNSLEKRILEGAMEDEVMDYLGALSIQNKKWANTPLRNFTQKY